MIKLLSGIAIKSIGGGLDSEIAGYLFIGGMCGGFGLAGIGVIPLLFGLGKIYGCDDIDCACMSSNASYILNCSAIDHACWCASND